MSDWKDRKNLFEWAKKELSQDAVIAWLLSGEYGKEFLLDMCPSLENDIKSVNVTTQEESIDVLVEVKNSNKEKIAVIIEDKTDTYLHDFQMLKYIAKIAGKGTNKNPTYQSVHFVLFKTGDIFAWEQEDYEHWKKELNEKKTRTFSADNLNKRVDGVLASDSYTKTDIEFKKVNNIVVEDIYTLDDFKDFLKDKESFDILNYYKEYLESKKQNMNKDEVIYATIKDYVKEYNDENNDKLHFEMVKPGGGGKREYEYNFLSKKMIVTEDDKKFIVLPFIAKREKKVDDKTTKEANGDNETTYEYQFTIHCHIVANENKLFGYVPWSRLTKEQRNAFSDFKKSIFEQRKDELEQSEWTLNNNFSKSNDESIDEDGKNNGLQLCKFASENFNDVNLEKLIDTALKIANLARNSSK